MTAALQSGSLIAYALVFLGGLVTSVGPCNVAMIPLVVSYVGGSAGLRRAQAFSLSLAFTCGLALTFVALGLVASLAGELIGDAFSSHLWTYLVAVVCLVVGLHMIGALTLPPLSGLGSIRERITLHGTPGALALGLVSGLVASQCATPILAAILTYALAKGSLGYGAALLFTYAFGRGVPIVLAGTFTGALKQLQAASRWSTAIERSSGAVMLAAGVYFLWIA